MKFPMAHLLIDHRYVDFMRQSHPHLNIAMSTTDAPCYSTRIDLTEAIRTPIFKYATTTAKPLLPWLFTPRTTIFGLPFEPYDQTPVLDYLPSLHDMKAIARTHQSELIAITNVQANNYQRHRLGELGFIALPSFPATSLKRIPNTFDSFVDHLSAARRRTIKRNLQAFHQAGHFIMDVRTDALSSQMYQAYWSTYARAKFKWLPHSAEYFCQWTKMGAHAKQFVALSKKREFLGFVNLIKFDDTVHVARLAILPSWQRRDAIFFRLLYRAIEYACEASAREVCLGPTTYGIKRRIGASMQLMQNFILPSSTKWRVILGILRDMIHNELWYLSSTRYLEEEF